MVLGRIRVSGLDHPLWRSCEFCEQPATDVRGSMVVRIVVLVFMVFSTAAAGEASSLDRFYDSVAGNVMTFPAPEKPRRISAGAFVWMCVQFLNGPRRREAAGEII
jgi:hypothetical protein